MSGNPKKSATPSDADRIVERLDKVTVVLENLFILQAVSLRIGRDSICSTLGIHTSRVSEINKGLKRAIKNGKNDV